MQEGILDITVQQRGAVAVFAVVGEVDMASAPDLVDRVREALRRGQRRLCIDLTEVTHLDSSGIAALVNVRRYTIRALGSLVLVCPEGRVLDVLELTGLARYFQIARSRAHALHVLEH